MSNRSSVLLALAAFAALNLSTANVRAAAPGCTGAQNGTVCDDGDACTQTDTCQSGVCVGGNPVVCTPVDQCHDAGVCDPASGACSTPVRANGSACNDGNACTQQDHCADGVCTPGTVAGCGSDEIFASNYGSRMVTIFVRSATGDVGPIRSIRTGLHVPHTLGIDRLHRELFVPNNDVAGENPAVHVYDLNASYPDDDAPKRTIIGALTQLDRPAGLMVDSVNQELYVANDLRNGNSAILVFPLGADGNVAPIRVLQGPLTTVEGPIGMALDFVHNELFIVSYKVADGGSITVFPRTASGNVSPLRTIQGPLTGFNNPQGLGLDYVHDELVVANSRFGTNAPGELLFYRRTDFGNLTPIRQIGGSNTGLCNPIGLVFDLVNDEIVVGNSHASTSACSQSLTTYARTASGNAAPLRQIGPGPLSALNNVESVAVRTSVDCADPSIATGTPCDDGNACTLTDTCQGHVCTGADPVTCVPSDQCHNGVCNTATGLCGNPAKPNGSVCSDGDPCTLSDTCQGGSCTPAGSVACTASDSCHDAGTCDSGTGACSNPVKPDGAGCSDGNACTAGDTCGGGVCHGGGAVSCNDNNPCTDDSCNSATGCAHTNNTNACNDGSVCTSGDVCGGGVCSGTAILCNDNNPCTTDTCNPASGCVFTNNTAACDDGDACTAGDTCGGGSCHGGGAVTCDDGNPCTDDSCNPATGCVHANNTNACNDGSACTSGDVCGGGVCGGTPIACNDNNPCTTDTCNPSSGCVFTNNTAPCNDGNACTFSDVCGGGTCHGGSAVTCDDNNLCTDDSCNPATGCVHANNSNPCDDGSVCTTGDVCAAGVCSGTAIVCNDDNPCTADTCDPLSGCVFTNDTAICDDGNACTDDSCNPATGCAHADNTHPCNDGNACTAGDTCGGGTCHGGAAVACDDNNPCTNDSCNPATGCVHANNTNPCDDGSLCTSGDVCSGGVCSGTAIVCNDTNPCTTDTCNPLSGCVFTNNTAACDDGNPCTVGDACAGGTCHAGTPIPPPPEVSHVTVAADKTTFNWSASPGATQYDVVRGSTSAFPVGTGGEVCFDNLAGTTLNDPTVPPAHTGSWYLSRAENACGIGTYGTRSNGAPRTTTTCP